MQRAIGLWVILLSLGGRELTAASIRGHVVDPSDAVVPGATLCLTNIDTGRAINRTSDARGNFSFLSLRPGNYTLRLEAPGFEKVLREGLKLRADEVLRVDIGLTIHARADQVSVTARAPNFQAGLEGRDIKESSARDVGEALTDVEGVWKVRKGGIANDIVLRGLATGNVNVLVDGVRIFGACPNHMDPPAFHVDFAEVQEVVVTKGAFDIKNEGSLGGLVEIISKDAPAGFHVTPSLSAGSYGFFNPSLTMSFSNGKVDALLGYSYRRSDPYRDGDGRLFTAYANYLDGARGRSAFGIQTGWGKLDISPRENQRLRLAYTRQAGDNVLYPYLLMDAPNDDADRVKAGYDISGLAPWLHRLRLESYYTQVNHWMTDQFRTSSVGAPRLYGMATSARTQALGFRMDAEISDLSVGMEAFRRNWTATQSMLMMHDYISQNMIPDVNISSAGAYADFHRNIFRNFHLEAGGRLDLARSAAQSATLNTDLYWAFKGTRSTSSTDTNPTGNLQLAYTLGKGISVFGGAGSTIRLPDPAERYFTLSGMATDWVGNPSLRPTRNNEVDVGINYAGGRLQLRPILFYSRLTDFIMLQNQLQINQVMGVMTMMAKSYANIDARLYGGEITYSVGITRSLLFLGGASYSAGSNWAHPEYRIFSTHLAEIPPLKSHAALRYGSKHFFGEITGKVVDTQRRVDPDLGEARTPGYFTAGVRAGFHAAKINLAAGTDNVLGRFYYEYLSYQRDPFRSGVKIPEPGRNLYLSAAYAF